MRILYVGKHGNRLSNDDEGAIAHSLQELGHDVITVAESRATITDWRSLCDGECDLLLMHHWTATDRLSVLPMPKVFWYFDLVEYADPTLVARNTTRRSWMERTIPYVDLGFCTDGDWVANDKSGKLIRLTQGFDNRARGIQYPNAEVPPILFTGISRGGGSRRISFVRELSSRFGTRFNHVSGGMHGERLAGLIAKSEIVVAPDSPITDRYWSNRVYLILGFGGFLLHPWSDGLAKQYRPGVDLCFYRNRDELYALIAYYLSHPNEREELRQAGHKRTLEQHTYKHRVEQLLRIVQERLFE